ncbi:MAG: tripartite tricarboxylate transporter substrate binding protein [Burkholderiaceae bacterium]|nr:tripartite tricarboxylate transporter substrate binding protein [Burkholderiaceae bacterium]
MKNPHPRARRLLCGLLGGLALTTLASGAGAQASYPDRPIRLVVGGPAGGAVDLSARHLGERLSALLGQPVLVDNKPGAAGVLGVQDLLKSPRDGYTFMVNLGGVASEIPHVVKLPFDPLKILRPLVEIGRGGLVLVTNGQTGASDLNSFIAYAKAHKGKVNYGSYSPGTVSHTLGLEFNKLMGLDMVHVGYRGSPLVLQDLMGGSVQAAFDGAGNVAPHLKGGKLKALATTAPQRLALLPDVPTFAELGFKDLTEVVWIGLWTTPDLPQPLQSKVRDATLKALQDPKLREGLAHLGMAPGSNASPEELLAGLRSASERHAATLQSVGFKPE